MPHQNALFSCILICAPAFLFSQDRVEKWGNIPESDLKMTVYQPDSSAAVVVLQDVGKIVLKVTGTVNFYRSRRIKVLDVSAFDQGNLMITYRASKSADELRDLDVQVTTPDGVKTKVKSDNVFTEKLSRRWSAKKIFIPNLQKGAVIEYRYEMRSEDMLTLYDWYFQDEIPVRWSEVEVTIPEYYDYIFLRNIPRPFDLEERSNGLQSGGVPGTVTRWGLANLPALKEEPYTTSVDDYRSSIKFQLRTVIIPGRAPETIISDWKELAKELDENDHFGVQYQKSGRFDKLWDAFKDNVAPGDPPEKIAAKALHFVSSQLKWDGSYRIFTDYNLDDVFEKKTGSSADLNLSVAALLQKAGLKATPLLLSTRSNGQMYPEYPFLTQFNSVVVLVQHGEKSTILDATNPFLPINQLNSAHYHGAAWMVDPKMPEWVDISAPEASQTWYGKMQLDAAGEMSGSFQIQTTNSTALEWRNKLNDTKQEAFLQKEFAAHYPETKLDSIQFSGIDDVDQPLSVKFKCRVPGAGSVVNDFIYCQPILDFFILESPFKSLSRSFPVEFTTPFKAQYIMEVKLPEGYTVEELPEAARVNLTNNAGKMTFSCSKTANGDLQVVLKMNIAKTAFAPEDYGALRQFFELVVEKTQLQLVLKKT